MFVDDLAYFLKFVFIAWLAILAGVIALKMLRGDINTYGMLRTGEANQLDPERVALMLLTVVIAGYYVVQALGVPLDSLYDRDLESYVLPDLPDEMLALLGGSHGAYLTGKFFRKKGGA